MKPVLRRFCSSAPGFLGNYTFYDAVITSGALKKKRLEKPRVVVFEGNTQDTEDNQKRIQNIFGGRLVGKKAVATSSRYFKGDSFTIAGVNVPEKPKEPDNCCMSGCINCVWEMFNDDLKEYHRQRRLAAERLAKTGGIWPMKYDPPLKWLKPENLPPEMRNKTKEEIEEMMLEQESEDGKERWESVSMDVFANLEKHLKSSHKAN